MLTIDALRQFGANTKDGLGRCMNNEAFYLRLVNMALEDANFGRLAAAIESGDKKEAFEAAHALKGVFANLSITPICEQVSKMTELLRADMDADYSALLAQLLERKNALIALRDQ